MSRRRIGQETFALGSSDTDRRCSLDDLRDLIDWAAIERLLASVSCSAKGEPARAASGKVDGPVLASW
jgi:transposase, IS5 family